MTMLALAVIAAATFAAFWVLSFYCLSPPSSALNLSDWECGTWWSSLVGVGIFVGGFALMAVAWRAIGRRYQ